MFEVPHAGKYHGDSMFIGSSNNIIISHRPTRLNNCLDPSLGRGINSIIDQEVKLGADVSVAVGPVGIGAEAATTVQLADVYSFSRARGAYAGASFEGAVIHGREDLNEEFYGSRVSATEIVLKKKHSSAEANKLRALLMGK